MRSKFVVCSFLMSAAFAFLLSLPGVAVSATRAVSASGCAKQFTVEGDYQGALCSLPIGSDMPSSAITGAYFDYVASVNAHVAYRLTKRSYTGSVYTDYGTTYTAGTKDMYLPAVNIKTSASIYDYLEGAVVGAGLGGGPGQGLSPVIGILLLTSN